MMNLIKILATRIGQTFYSPAYGDVMLFHIVEAHKFPIKIKSKSNEIIALLPDGKLSPDGELMLFPSKENRDWSTLYYRSKPDIDALLDLVDANKLISFLKKNLKEGDKVKTLNNLEKNALYGCINFPGVYVCGQIEQRIYVTLFKIENVKHMYSVEMFDLSYILNNNPRLVYLVEENLDSLKRDSKFDPSTLEPFDKVLVRDLDSEYWQINLFQNLSENRSVCLVAVWNQVIPYNPETQHLVNTKNKPPKKYIYW